MKLKNFIGDKAFYKTVISITLPIIIQNGITNFVNLLDNIMVGLLGTEQLSGVGIANQLTFVFTLVVFGSLSGSGIFTAQYHGKGDVEGIRNTFRYKILTIIAVIAVGGAVLIPFGSDLISLFLVEGDTTADAALTLAFGRDYLRVALISLVPMAFTQVYANTLRETGQTVPPMIASIVAVATNALFNFLLIFGVGPFPALGVVGAAWGTVIARIVELAIVVTWTHLNTQKAPYIVGVYRSLRIPAHLAARITVKMIPLMLNEFLWSSGMAFLTQCYSTRGLVAVAAVNISSTISNLFNIVYMSMGNAVSIIVGNQLGAGEIERAKDTDRKIIAFSSAVSVIIGAIMSLFAPLFTSIYNVTDEVKSLAALLIITYAIMMPFNSFIHNCYFTLRSGGHAFITFLFDSTFIWGICVPVAFVISRFTALPILPLFIITVSLDLLKCIIGAFLLKSGKWARKLV